MRPLPAATAFRLSSTPDFEAGPLSQHIWSKMIAWTPLQLHTDIYTLSRICREIGHFFERARGQEGICMHRVKPGSD